MEIRDPVHGSIKVQKEEIQILEHPFFQRLRNIKQLGFSEYVFPGATHTRYLHSIGVMETVSRVFDQVFRDKPNNPEWSRLRETVRLGCLLHDIGHAPLSHTTEFVMPQVSELKLPTPFAPAKDYKATHEDYTIKSVVDSSFTESFAGVKTRYGVDPNQVAGLIKGESPDPEYFTVDGVNYFPILSQLVSSEMDCDRMDYLLRDSYFCGVSYGKFDLDWIIDNLRCAPVDGKAFLAISERAVSTFDDFLLCRFHMFLMVYFHYKAVCLEKMLGRYFNSSNNEYSIPANIEEYLEHDDHFLMKVLRASDNEWAKKIMRNNIPPKIFETFGSAQLKNLENIENYLTKNNIDYIKCSSSGRLSKYYNEGNESETGHPIKVVREHSMLNGKMFVQNIDEATDLYQKFSNAHSVNRIHCDFDELSQSQIKDLRELADSI